MPPPELGLGSGEIAGIVIGCIAGIALIGLAALMFVRLGNWLEINDILWQAQEWQEVQEDPAEEEGREGAGGTTVVTSVPSEASQQRNHITGNKLKFNFTGLECHCDVLYRCSTHALLITDQVKIRWLFNI